MKKVTHLLVFLLALTTSACGGGGRDSAADAGTAELDPPSQAVSDSSEVAIALRKFFKAQEGDWRGNGSWIEPTSDDPSRHYAKIRTRVEKLSDDRWRETKEIEIDNAFDKKEVTVYSLREGGLWIGKDSDGSDGQRAEIVEATSVSLKCQITKTSDDGTRVFEIERIVRASDEIVEDKSVYLNGKLELRKSWIIYP